MSVIIFYQNQTTFMRDFLEIRGLGGSVGIDKTGSITMSNILEYYFSIYSIGQEYVLSVNEQNVLLPKYYEMKINNIVFYFYTILPTNESLAYTCYNQDLMNVKNRDFVVLNIQQNLSLITIKLYTNIEYYLGSSIVSSIYLNQKFIAPYHLKIIVNKNQFNIVEIAGRVKKESDTLYAINDISLEFIKEDNFKQKEDIDLSISNDN